MEFDAAKLTEAEQYKLMTGTVVPRPIALVTTLGEKGVNAAPFSFFNVAGTDPPTVFLAVGFQEDGSEKDTIQNLRCNPEFVVHIVSHDIVEKMNICATNFPPGVDELAEAGLTPIPSRKVRPPRIAESPAHFECRLTNMIEVGSRHHIVLGEVVWFHYRDGVVDERMRVDFASLDPVGRLAGAMYARLTDTFKLARPYI